MNLSKNKKSLLMNDMIKENKEISEKVFNEKEKTFFEIKITIDEMTSELALIVTDFCLPEEEEDCVMLWESAMENLKHAVGG